ncbi:uncharacterized protein LOC110187833 [Drosophila serrata]|uniref:uncharacterized protein LOC110187833 n=1 Tax=Drosophila serrata TaxID=7274 RepID=UPI000A1D00D4|nr:uncharacterized protein LOC110187833 [Drosophila serrata]
MESSDSHDIELEALQEEEFSDEDVSNDSLDLNAYEDLFEENTRLERKVNALKLKVVALQIQTNYQENQLNKLRCEKKQKATFSRSINRNLLLATRHSLQSQTLESFPNRLFSQIFEGFPGDDKVFRNHFKNMDNELDLIVQKMCVHAYKSRKLSLQSTVAEKAKGLKKELILKYGTQLAERDKTRAINNCAIKRQCFHMFKNFLMSSIQDKTCAGNYLKQLENLYEQEISKLD